MLEALISANIVHCALCTRHCLVRDDEFDEWQHWAADGSRGWSRKGIELLHSARAGATAVMRPVQHGGYLD